MMSSGDWMCGSCQHINFKKRELCQKCRCPKFGENCDTTSYEVGRTEEVLAGDWYCTTSNCGAHNYASRTHCYMCGAPKICYWEFQGNLPPGWKAGDWICNRWCNVTKMNLE
ncbi:hypothetical protein LguiB_018253 [Lonicera macranthoides]